MSAVTVTESLVFKDGKYGRYDEEGNFWFASEEEQELAERQHLEGESLNDYHFASEEDTTAGHISIDTFSRSAVDLLSAESKGVYLQYVKDSNDTLLIDGYFRMNTSNLQLPPEVSEIIAAYYLKAYSVRNLHNKITSLRMFSI